MAERSKSVHAFASQREAIFLHHPAHSFCSVLLQFHFLPFTLPQEEDATVWARYSSAQFDQGAGRHACNNPYNAQVDEDIVQEAINNGKTAVSRKKILDSISPSFAGIEDPEDMSAILARTHLIGLTDAAVYFRFANTDKGDVDFITWPNNEPRDLLTPEQKLVFQEYKKNPDGHTLPQRFHEDAVWSQELIRKLMRGEYVPRTITIRGRALFGGQASTTHQPPSLLPPAEMQAKVKQEELEHVFKQLKRKPCQIIDLDSPSPLKHSRRGDAVTAPQNLSFNVAWSANGRGRFS